MAVYSFKNGVIAGTMGMKPHISIVVPIYGCKNCLLILYRRLRQTLDQINPNFEIILVNDCSPDNPWEVIQEISTVDPRVKGINLSRNFGQHYAITAGVEYSSGDWVVVMDCDLQDQPEEIIKLYQKAQEGYNVVFGRRYERQDNLLKRLSSTLFFKVYDYFTEGKSDNSVANFSIVSRNVIRNFIKIREQHRTFPLFVKWLGFKTAYVDIKHSAREEGKSSYSFRKLLRLAGNNIIAQSNKPLRLSINFGFTLSILSFLYGTFLIMKYFFLKTPISGWTSVMVSVYFIGGLLFANMGILGLYIGKIFNETKNRPLYIVMETIGLEHAPLNEYNERKGDFNASS